MPTPPKKRVAALRRRARLSRWTRSKRGNLYRRLPCGVTMTVFRRRWDDSWGYCIHDDGDTTFSPQGYETEARAAEAAERMIDDDK